MSDNLTVTRKTNKMVNRVDQLAAVEQAVYEGEGVQVVLVKAQGGMGKTRLAEEILWRGGNRGLREERGAPLGEEDWQTRHPDAKVVFADLIDLIDPRLHTRNQLMVAIRDSLVGQGKLDFSHFDIAVNRYRRLREQRADYQIIRQADDTLQDAFFADYQENTQKQRIVLILDTTEKLCQVISDNLRKLELIPAEALIHNTDYWIANKIRGGLFANTTLVLIGRGEEGRSFFELVSQAAEDAQTNIITVETDPFTLEDTRTYLEYQQQDLEKLAEGSPQNSRWRAAAINLAAILALPDQIHLLWVYTGGQPVRLALYSDLMVEGHTPPQALIETLDEAHRRWGVKNPEAIPEELLSDIRAQIEKKFIDLLFHHPCLRTEILLSLVRAPRGLAAEQLQFLLYASPTDAPGSWQPDKRDQNELSEELKEVANLALVKCSPDGRFALQDEVYRLYSRAVTGISQEDEKTARLELCDKLSQYAADQLEKAQAVRREFMVNDERSLWVERPSKALDAKFIDHTDSEQRERTKNEDAVRFWQVEHLHYLLRLDPLGNFNDTYFDLVEQTWRANDEEAEIEAQEVLWQVLWDEDNLPFLPLQPWPHLLERGGDALDSLRNIARQDEAVRWIKRYDLRREYSKAIEFYQAYEEYLQDASSAGAETNLHTFARAERACWMLYAKLMASLDTEQTLKDLQYWAEQLQPLLKADQIEIVYPERGRGEKGFKGHPAETRMKRVLSLIYHYMGYGYAQEGRSGDALDAYKTALYYLRGVYSDAQQANTRNNLARVLSDLGRSYARDVCQDALQLRRKIADGAPVAYSLNTLALIDNDFNRTSEAWVEAAKAVAYFRRLDDGRGLGLALIQLGEALRRLAGMERTGSTLTDPPEILINQAENALTQAIEIFSIAIKEPLRYVEAQIEMGCIQRDRIRLEIETNGPKMPAAQQAMRLRYRDAIDALDKAINKAEEIKNHRLVVDANVNKAFTHYFFAVYQGDPGLLQFALEQSSTALHGLFDKKQEWLLKKGQPPPNPVDEILRNEVYLFQQLSRMSALQGRIGMAKFIERRDWLGQDEPDRQRRHERVHEDDEARAYLNEAARRFAMAMAYAQLYSPFASTLDAVEEGLYGYLKKFNQTELEDFKQYQKEAHDDYRLDELATRPAGSLADFLDECFGTEALRQSKETSNAA